MLLGFFQTYVAAFLWEGEISPHFAGASLALRPRSRSVSLQIVGSVFMDAFADVEAAGARDEEASLTKLCFACLIGVSSSDVGAGMCSIRIMFWMLRLVIMLRAASVLGVT